MTKKHLLGGQHQKTWRPINKENTPVVTTQVCLEENRNDEPERTKKARHYGRKSRRCYACRKTCLQAAEESATGAREEAQAACLKKAALEEVRQFYICHFGFISSHKCTPKHNATLHLADLPAWFYYQHPSNLSCHDLTHHTYAIPPPNFRALLGLGLKFIPRPRYTTSTIIKKSIAQICKDLFNKCIYAGSNDTYDPYLYAPSNRPPPKHLVPSELKNRIDSFASALCNLYCKRHAPSNLLPHQWHCLDTLSMHPDLLVMKTDKNLGPALLERNRYICMAYVNHLFDCNTYVKLTHDRAIQYITETHTQFERWLCKYAKVIPKTEAKYLRRTCILLDKDGKINFPQLYLLAKIHKDPFSTRPIVSVSGSPLHGLAHWVDRQLQPLAQSIPSYIKSSFEFVKKIQLQQATMPFPATALLFTCDAVAMYTNINTTKALEELQPRTQEHVLKALEIIMRRNSFQFSDTYWRQKQGTAMGTPPACMWATLFFASHEQHLNEQYNKFLLHWSRYIDDGFGVWN